MKILKSNRGSSSILVAMVLVILVVFSVLAVTTSVSNLRLAEKNAATVSLYYSLDSDGERFLYEIRKDIEDSMKKADSTISDFSQGVFSEPEITSEISEMVQNTLSGLSLYDEKQEYLTDLFGKLVIYYAQKEIKAAYPDSIWDSQANYLEDAAVYSNNKAPLSFNIKRSIILEYENNYRYLNVILNVSDPARDKKPDEICIVQEWKLWQEPFEYKNQIDLWEGRP